MKFINVSSEEARGDDIPLKATQKASKVYLSKLWLTKEQHQQLTELYAKSMFSSQEYHPESEADQLAAASWLATVGLDLDGRKGLEVLYQKRTGKIIMVRGYFEHNQDCHEAFLTRIPPMPLHPSVFEVALTQLRGGAHLSDIQDKNRQMFRARAYNGQPRDLHGSPFRWLMRKSDTRSLYRQFNRLRGVDTAQPAHLNVDAWLDPSSATYNKTFAAAVFHYSARAVKEDRFEVCIATPEMKEASWKYAHQSQIILDGTFGLCDKKLLLFIIMGVDEKKRGVPLAFLLFSAPSGNQNTSAGYNTEILTRLISRWQAALGSRDDAPFAPRVAITDTDLKERGALLNVFPSIWLLLCKFHLRQSWRNHRSRVIKGNSPYHDDVRTRLRRLEESLIATTVFADAVQLLARERAALEGEDDPAAEEVITGSRAHLDYLENYWLSEALWCSWSDYGRIRAAELLGCPIEGVLPTTNHLESFNGVLKRKHIRRWQRGGRRLRVDVLLHLFVFSILPSVFEACALEAEADRHETDLLMGLPGGEALLRERGRSVATTHHHIAQPTAASCIHGFIPDDETRNKAAQTLLTNGQIGVPVFQDQSLTFVFDCLSSLAIIGESTPTIYAVSIGLDGWISCSCADFQHQQGAACKHIRAALLRLQDLRQKAGLHIPHIKIPQTRMEALTRFCDNLDNNHHSGPLRCTPPPLSEIATTSPVPRPDVRAAQLVEDMLSESGDIFENPRDISFTSLNLASPNDGEMPPSGTRESENDAYLSMSEPDTEVSGSECDIFDIPQPHRSTTPITSTTSVTTSSQPITEAPRASNLEMSRAGLHRQTLAHVLHELESQGPRLREFSALLSGVELLPQEAPRVRTVRDTLDLLSGRLSELLITHGSEDARERSPLDTAVMPTSPSEPTQDCRYGKRRASASMMLLPPSPEKAQKRHESHSIH
ncbi:hypothetical protein ACG7TL_002702 [Trametes sanguinea]